MTEKNMKQIIESTRKLQCFLSDDFLNDVSESSDLTKKSNFDLTELENKFADTDKRSKSKVI